MLTLCYTGNVKFDDGSRVRAVPGGEQPDGPLKTGASAGAAGLHRPRAPESVAARRAAHMCWARRMHKQGKVLLFRSADLHMWESMEKSPVTASMD